MSKITYINKSFINENPDVAAQNKVSAADMNEIKNVVNNNTPAGSIILYGGTSVPTGWLICDGSAVSRTTYSSLFTAIGTTYGAGNGSTTFNLPNLKGKVPVGQDSNDSSFDTLGETGGSKDLQEHSHTYNISTSGAGGSDGTRLVVWNGTGTTYNNASGAIANTGTGTSGNLQPYIVLNYIISY